MAEDVLLKRWLKHLDIAVFVKSETGQYLFANSAASLMLNKDSKDLIGLNDFDIFAKSSAHVIRARDCAILHEKKVYAYHSSAALKDASNLTTFTSVKRPIFDRASHNRGLLGLSFKSEHPKVANLEIRELLSNVMRIRCKELLELCSAEVNLDV